MRSLLFLFIFLCHGAALFAQEYILNGSATKISCYCYQLTNTNSTFQTGSVWNATKINLNNAFDFSFNVFCGCKDVDGADGIVFMLQPISTSIGNPGEGMGFAGVSPSIGITLDTYQNTNRNDPAYDHISIQANGIIDHGSDLAGPVQVSAFGDNVEDCLFRTLRISWDPASQLLRTYFDGQLRLEKQIDLINTIFKGDPFVYWGFSAATGGFTNDQFFCTALNPSFSVVNEDIQTCANIPIGFKDESTSFGPVLEYAWDFGDGTTSSIANPVHTYTTPGEYTVSYTITGFDGCVSDPLKRKVIVGDKPTAAFQVFDTCTNTPLRIINNSQPAYDPIANYTWYLNGSLINNNSSNPLVIIPGTGISTIELVATSQQGCVSDKVVQYVNALPVPAIDAAYKDGCVGDNILFSATQNDNATTITNWKWTINNVEQFGTSVQQQFSLGGYYPVSLQANADNGCTTIINQAPILINAISAHAGNDTIAIKDIPFALGATATQIGTENLLYSWTPPNFLNDASLKNPIATLQDDERFYLTIFSTNGCTDTSSVYITVFKGSSVFVPNAFTPNNDGLNDILKPYLIGIKTLNYFRIFNRYGQEVFTTNSLANGWDGKLNGTIQDGSFSWILSAIDFVNKVYTQKGIVTLIR